MENCSSRQVEISKRSRAMVERISRLQNELRELCRDVERLFYEQAVVTGNSCCPDSNCPKCSDYPEKQQLLFCNTTVDTR